MSSTKRRLNLERFRSRREAKASSSATKSSTTTPTMKDGKIVVSYAQYAQQRALNEAVSKSQTKATKKPVVETHATTPKSSTVLSPLAQSIRQQILTHSNKKSVASDTGKDELTPRGPPSSRRQRWERRKERLASKSPHNNYLTPMGGRSGAVFFPEDGPSGRRPTASSYKEEEEVTPTLSTPPLSSFDTDEEEKSSPDVHSNMIRSRPAESTSVTPVTATKSTAPVAPKTTGKIMNTSRLRRNNGSRPRSRVNKSKNTTPRSVGRSPLRHIPNTYDADEDSNDSSNLSTRRNLDKKTARLRYSKEFAAGIAQYDLSSHISPKVASSRDKKKQHELSPIQIYVRKRPIFPHELERSDFDVVSIQNDNLVVHRTQMAKDMRKKEIEQVLFQDFTAAFSSNVESQQVYERAFSPMVDKVLCQESTSATLLMFGQTGSGKTYTMTACQDHLASHIFDKPCHAQVQAIELAGKTCRDLMGDSGMDAGTPVFIQDDADGSVRFKGAESVIVSNPQDLVQILACAQDRRSTQSTLQNDVSSRSHAVYQIRLLSKEERSNEKGILTLIDCAGTERRNDSLYHTAERQSESNEINASLFNLKKCVRALRDGSSYIPYRENLLTRVLRESLESDSNALAVIATIAPNATDTEHTLETLKTVASWTGSSCSAGGMKKITVSNNNTAEESLKSPKQWNHKELVEWMERKKKLPKGTIVPERLTGREVMRMSKLVLRVTFYAKDEDLTRADNLFGSLRRESDLVGRQDLKRRFRSKSRSRA